MSTLLRNLAAGLILLSGACLTAPAMAEEEAAAPSSEEATAAETTQTASTEAAATTASTNDENKLICKYSKDTGTRLRRVKSCATKAEWARRSTNATRTVNEMQADNQGQSGSR